MRRLSWALIACFALSACTALGGGGAEAPRPQETYTHTNSSSYVDLYWNCALADGGLRVSGVVHNARAGRVWDASVEADGVDAQGRSVVIAKVGMADSIIFINQASPFRVELKTTGTETRIDLVYQYRMDMTMGEDRYPHYLVRDACSPTQNLVGRAPR
jgi:hypothetical protein